MEKKTIPDMKKHIGYGLLALLMTACHESYPGLYAPVYDPDNPNPEVTTDRLPVMISLTDPAYALVTTRGNGPFGFWDDPEAQTAWLSAQSEKIDAQIDLKLAQTYLQKAMGTLDGTR